MLQYALPIFLGAFLLFQVQPIIARCILPWFGGAPAVWTTCMLFFQLLLLAGYAYAHAVVTRLRPRAQATVHSGVVLLSLALMALLVRRWGVPIIPDASWKPANPDFPIPHILALLTVSVGLPYFILSTTSPMLQAWFARTRPGVSPYRLYTLSNTGSLLALLSYPFLIEPALAMRAQGAWWSSGYVVFALGIIVCALEAARAQKTATVATAEDVPQAEAPPTGRTRLLWVGLPALASTLLLAVTNQICQEVAVIPFLWILPLSLYLLSFIICFDNPRWYVRAIYLPALLLILPVVVWVMSRQSDVAIRLQLAIYTLALFIACMFCHGELVARRPSPRHLTAFYLAISLGGAVGGLFVALLAPLIFKRFYELHLSVALCWGLGLLTLYRWPVIDRRWRLALTTVLLVVTVALPLRLMSLKHNLISVPLLASRSFYGVFRVDDDFRFDPKRHVHTLIHGGTVHGLQFWQPQRRHEPVSYYSLDSGVGLAVRLHPRRLARHGDHSLRVGVVGLGTGTMAAYGRPADFIDFYEINPAVEKMARDPRYFTYLSDCRARLQVTLGDGRLSLERELKTTGSQRFDVLVLDAFSSDAIPAHLLTREAFALYLAHLRGPDSVLAVHVSNRALDLRPIVWGLADAYHLKTALVTNHATRGIYAADWILVTANSAILQNPQIAKQTQPREPTRRLRLWTDDYYNLFNILR